MSIGLDPDYNKLLFFLLFMLLFRSICHQVSNQTDKLALPTNILIAADVSPSYSSGLPQGSGQGRKNLTNCFEFENVNINYI